MGKVVNQNYGGLSCLEITPQLINDYFRGNVSIKIAKKLDVHLSDCGRCNEKLVELTERVAENAGEDEVVRMLRSDERSDYRSLDDIKKHWASIKAGIAAGLRDEPF